MEIKFSDQAYVDLKWFDIYFSEVFPDGKVKAYNNFEHSLILLSEFPEIGKLEEGDNVREYQIKHTVFSLVYELRDDLIIILSVWDTRKNPENRNLFNI